jgi:hypothetical protein
LIARTLTIALISQSLTSGLILAAPQPQIPQDSRIVVIRKMPAGEAANLKKINKAELEKLLGSGRGKARILTEKTIAASRAQSQKVRAENRAAIQRLYQKRPELLRHVLRISSKEEIKATFAGRNGARRPVVLLGGDALIRDALYARRMLESRDNQLKTYETLYNKIQQRLGDAKKDGAAAFKNLSNPASLRTQPVRQIDEGLARLVDFWRTFIPGGRITRGAAPSCSREEGAGSGGDRTMEGPNDTSVPDQCGELNPQGLRALHNWPLKPFNTCVRNQAARGTCVSFAVNAAMESAIAVKYNRWVNLSEQDLFKKYKLDWFPIPSDYYGDGYSPPISLLLQMISIYRHPFERDWDYNPSRKRTDNDTTRTYTRSCTDYNDPNCSNTNHQSKRTCYQADVTVVKEVVREVCTVAEAIPLLGILASLVCNAVTELVEFTESVEVCLYDTSIPGTSNFMATGASTFYDPIFTQETGIALAKLNLDSLIPVTFSFTTTPSFRNAVNTGGFVAFSESEVPSETDDGGHALLLTGYVDNANLPAGVAQGAGGGYFIAKNSWGCDFGDQGYAYLPYDWVRKWGYNMVALNSIN